MCCANNSLKKGTIEKQLCKDMHMKEVSITRHPHIVGVYSSSMVSVPEYHASPHHAYMHMLCMNRCVCMDVQEATNMNRTVVSIIMVSSRG